MQRLNHHHLYIFWIFGKTGSFTKTAEEIRIAQSAVTLQIKQLEDALGLLLIDRTNPRKPSLTSEGLRVLEYADSIFEFSRELINWATKGELPNQKTLRIGAISGLSRNLQYEFISPFVSQPEYKFYITTGDQKKLIDLLLEHSLDVVLTSRNIAHESAKQFYTHVLTTSPLVIVANSSFKLKSKASLQEKLSGQALFIPGNHFEAKPELDAFLEGFKNKIRIAGEIDDIALLRVLALKSGSLVAIPEMGISNEIKTGEVKVIHNIHKIEQKFYAITRHKLKPNDEIKYLIDKMS